MLAIFVTLDWLSVVGQSLIGETRSIPLITIVISVCCTSNYMLSLVCRYRQSCIHMM